MAMRRMDATDVAILRVLDGMQRSHEFVPARLLHEKLPFGKTDIARRLSYLHANDYVRFTTIKELRDETGVRITEWGLDALAIWDFKKHGVIKSIGTQVGSGKESIIVSASSAKGQAVIKFHRYWQAEFRNIKKSLSWAAVKLRGAELGIEDYEMDVPRAKAQVEYNVLVALRGVIPVPEPYGLNRHAVCMQLIGEGVPAKRVADVTLSNPRDALDVIVEDYNKAVAAGWVHGDFSEFNVLVTATGDLCYIDWPQAVPADYPGAGELMERDLRNIREHFKKKYGVTNV